MAPVSSDRPLNERVVDFLYVLMRQEVVPGGVEDVLQNHVEQRGTRPDFDRNTFSNKGLELYAREVAARLHAYVS